MGVWVGGVVLFLTFILYGCNVKVVDVELLDMIVATAESNDHGSSCLLKLPQQKSECLH